MTSPEQGPAAMRRFMAEHPLTSKADARPAWLWRRTADDSISYWLCEQCDTRRDYSQNKDSSARDHVTSTGHTVTIIDEYRTTLEGVVTDGGAAHV